jgi:hypothetical protein
MLLGKFSDRLKIEYKVVSAIRLRDLALIIISKCRDIIISFKYRIYNQNCYQI